MSRPPAPCHECHADRPGGLHGKRRGRIVPLCASCKAAGQSRPGTIGLPKYLQDGRAARLNALLRPMEVPACP